MIEFIAVGVPAVGAVVAGGGALLEMLAYLSFSRRYFMLAGKMTQHLDIVDDEPDLSSFMVSDSPEGLLVRRSHGVVRRLLAFVRVERDGKGGATLHYGAGPVSPVFWGLWVMPSFGVMASLDVLIGLASILIGLAFAGLYLLFIRSVAKGFMGEVTAHL